MPQKVQKTMKPILLALALPVVALTGCSTYVGDTGPGYGGGYYADGPYYGGPAVVDVGIGGGYYGGGGYYNRGGYYHHSDSGYHHSSSVVAFHNASRSGGTRVASVGHSGGASHSAASASVGHAGGGGGHSGGGHR